MEGDGVFYIPTGTFIVRSSLIFKTNYRFTITGDGLKDGSELSQLTIRDFAITSSAILKPLDKFAIYAQDLVQSQIEHIIINSNDSKSSPVSSGIAM
ncbi:unnamed protein product, partial [Rotaria sp. Silwood1]